MVRLGHRFPPAGRGGRQQQQQPQPAAAASSTGLRDTREGGERGARGRSRPGGSRRADRAPREGRTPSPQPRRGRGGAGCCQGARCCCCQGPAHVTLGWRRALVRLRRARGGRVARSRARRARPHSPGGAADLGGPHRGIRHPPRRWGIRGQPAAEMHDRRIAVESKIGVDLGGFFVVFAVAIWRWDKRLKFNVENSASAPWLLSARQKLA